LKRLDGPIDTEAAAEQPPKKKAKKLRDFEVPEHLRSHSIPTLMLKRIEKGLIKPQEQA
jgi:uncharacterized protein (DUF342 family)